MGTFAKSADNQTEASCSMEKGIELATGKTGN